MQPRVRNALIFLLTLGLLALFVRNVDVSGVWTETRRANPAPLILAVAITGVTYAVRALRWQYLLSAIGPTHFRNALRTTIIGFAATFLLPARAGEVIRPYLLSRKEGLNATAAFATIILERLLDLITVLFLFATFVLTAQPGSVLGDPAQFARVKFGGLIAAGAGVAGAALLFVLAGHPERMGRMALRIERILPPKLARTVATFVETFAQGLAVMRQPRQMAVALLLSLPLWLALASGIWLTSQAFHITFPFPASFLLLTTLVVGVAVPTPGAVGGFHLAYQLTVQMFFGASPERAVGAAIVLHAISFVPVTLVGIGLMASDGLTLAGARRIAAEKGGEKNSGNIAQANAAALRADRIRQEAEGRAR